MVDGPETGVEQEPKRQKGLTILLLSGAMMCREGNIATRLIKNGLEMGYRVNLFCFGEAITAVKKGQNPKRFPNLGADLKTLMEKGLNIAVCSTCAEARGFVQADLIEGATIGSLTNDFSGYIEKSDRIVTLGR